MKYSLVKDSLESTKDKSKRRKRNTSHPPRFASVSLHLTREEKVAHHDKKLYREKTPSTIKKEMEELENMVCHK
jgi:hypothetical protein